MERLTGKQNLPTSFHNFDFGISIQMSRRWLVLRRRVLYCVVEARHPEQRVSDDGVDVTG